MLKTTEVYSVAVTLTDGQTLLCTLLSKPDPETLVAVATAQNAPADFSKVLALAADIAIPAVGERMINTEISVVGTVIGTVRVDTQLAYGSPARRPRTPKIAKPKSVPIPVEFDIHGNRIG